MCLLHMWGVTGVSVGNGEGRMAYFAGGARREVISQTLKRSPKNAND